MREKARGAGGEGLEKLETGPQSSEDDTAQDDPTAALVDKLQKQIDSLSEAVERLCKDLEAQRPEARSSAFQPDDAEEVTPGRPQAIPGQIKSTSHKQVTWKGVL